MVGRGVVTMALRPQHRRDHPDPAPHGSSTALFLPGREACRPGFAGGRAMTLLEPDVALTDFGLAAECALFAGWLLARARGRAPVLRWFVILFAALGLGALLGGISHGFLADHQSALSHWVWIATMLAIGVVALAGWAIGAHLLLTGAAVRGVLLLAGGLFAVYAAVVLFVSQSFAVAVINYIAGTVFALAAFVLVYARRRAAHMLPGIAGLVLSFAAAGIQQGRIGLPALGLTHNALYHLVQALALLLIFLTARGMAQEA
jgi:hypothetical protein